MMKKEIFVLIVFFAFFVLLGCVNEPTYQFCCESDYAFPTDGSTPICRGTDANGELQELSVNFCDEENWLCNLTIDGNTQAVPVCPKIDTIKCNTSCTGIFCGRFFFDPRPAPQSYPRSELHSADVDESVEMDFSDEALGLWGAKCIVEDMDKDFLRKLENSKDITMNIFRFGVGDSFQDFESAQYFFPITDRACRINIAGETDRYLLYAIPNKLRYGKLCEVTTKEIKLAPSTPGINEGVSSYLSVEQEYPSSVSFESAGGSGTHIVIPTDYSEFMEFEYVSHPVVIPKGTYVCKNNDKIYSKTYFDCASRCALDYYGYPPEIEPNNPYLSWYKNRIVGNPFIYGPTFSYKYQTFGDGKDRNALWLDTKDSCREEVKFRKATSSSHANDEYLTGNVLYGASFGMSKTCLDSTDYSDTQMTSMYTDNDYPFMSSFGYASAHVSKDGGYGDRFSPTLAQEEIDGKHYLLFDWDSLDGTESGNAQQYNFADTFFLTIENSSQSIYPFLLAHHSVYNKQFEQGHLTLDGTHRGGAEFECSTGSDCISGYCNTFDYKRGACVDSHGNDILCDCKMVNGKTFCLGTATQSVRSWDDDNVYVETPVVLSASVNADGDTERGWTKTFTSVPAIGTVKKINFYGVEDGEEVDIFGEGVPANPMPIFIMSLGGQGQEFTASDGNPRFAPDYTTFSKNALIIPQDSSLYSDPKGMEIFRRLQNLLNPCSIHPYDPNSKNYWTFSHVEYVDKTRPGKPKKKETVKVTNIFYSCCGNDKKCVKIKQDANWEDDHEMTFVHGGKDPHPGSHATRFLENCMGGYEKYVHVCFDKNINYDVLGYYIPRKYFKDKPVGKVKIHFTGWDSRNTPLNRALKEQTEEGYGLCGTLWQYQEDSDNDGAYITGYQYEGGSMVPLSEQDEAFGFANSYIAIEPRWVEEDTNGDGETDVVGWAYGRCMLDSSEKNLELHEYGMCEGCGFLTMAKQTITALPEDSRDPGFEMTPDDRKDNDLQHTFIGGGKTYGNTYCPDMVISTPQNIKVSKLMYRGSDDDYDLGRYFYRSVELFGMGGYVHYLFGSNEWTANNDIEKYDSSKCMYPNGDVVYDKEINGYPKNRQRGLPYTQPNAYYINSKLESLMKRNVQPVIFATDDLLWMLGYGKKYAYEKGDVDTYNLFLSFDSSADEDEQMTATNTLMPKLFLERNYLFNNARNNGNNYFSMGSFLANTIINEGAVILVVDNFPSYCNGDNVCVGESNFDNNMIYRPSATRLLCPNCMVAVGVGYLPEGPAGKKNPKAGSFDMEEQLKEISSVFGYTYSGTTKPIGDFKINTTCIVESGTKMDDGTVQCSSAINKVDAIALSLTLKDGDDYCSISDENARFEAIFGNITLLGRTSLLRFRKPIIISDFVINRKGDCWDEDSAGRFMTYLGMHTDLLVKSGYAGIIYGDWEGKQSDETAIRFNVDWGQSIDGKRGNFYNGTFVASRHFAGLSTKIYYNEMIAKHSCECIRCSPINPKMICNGGFKGDPSLGRCTGFSETKNMWPESCVTNYLCKDIHQEDEGDIDCDIFYDNGTTSTITVPISTVAAMPTVYKDIIASMEGPQPICVKTDSGEKISYQAEELGGFASTPLVFSKDGNPNVVCDPSQVAGESFCGYIPHIYNYKLKCRFSSPE